jgi:hypothetical protein
MTLRNLQNSLLAYLPLSGFSGNSAISIIASVFTKRSMLFLLVVTSECECTDDQDRYFALYSLFAESEEANWPLKLNYDYILQDILF